MEAAVFFYLFSGWFHGPSAVNWAPEPIDINIVNAFIYIKTWVLSLSSVVKRPATAPPFKPTHVTAPHQMWPAENGTYPTGSQDRYTTTSKKWFSNLNERNGFRIEMLKNHRGELYSTWPRFMHYIEKPLVRHISIPPLMHTFKRKF